MIPPAVSVIVPHHLDENWEYLKLCLDSILDSSYKSLEILCVADTKKPPKYESKDRRLAVCWKPDLKTASAKINWAVNNSRGVIILIVSDDVMIAKDMIERMVPPCHDNDLICNPMSNSDNGAQFFCDLGIPIKLSKEDLRVLATLNIANCVMPKPFLIPVRSFISFYCTMMSRSVWNRVGFLDERLDARHNDQDYCIRASKLGIPSMINLGAFALHFGDKTLPKCTTKEDLDNCTQVFLDKWKNG